MGRWRLLQGNQYLARVLRGLLRPSPVRGQLPVIYVRQLSVSTLWPIRFTVASRAPVLMQEESMVPMKARLSVLAVAALPNNFL